MGGNRQPTIESLGMLSEWILVDHENNTNILPGRLHGDNRCLIMAGYSRNNGHT